MDSQPLITCFNCSLPTMTLLNIIDEIGVNKQMESNNESNHDSISVERNSKGYNYTAKCYINGGEDKEDTEKKLKLRLDRYVEHLETKYGKSAPY